jgi:hypothetical protein
MAKGGGGKKRPASDQSEDGQGSHHEPSTKKSKVQQGSTNLKDKTIGVATRRTSDRGIRDDFLSRPDVSTLLYISSYDTSLTIDRPATLVWLP